MKIEELAFTDFFQQIIPNFEELKIYMKNRKFRIGKGITFFVLSLNEKADSAYSYSFIYDGFFVFDYEIKGTCSIKKANYVIGYFEARVQSPMAEDEKQDIKSFIESFTERDSEKTKNTIKALQNLIMELE